ncbi:hypothetical protein CPLU01_02881 [Colletotrichum plurivorum]|uniref:Uncharacterized protein n=1 Tax=Colletotrichum plurivorum TaxID=2175906 RepID=A0A8H6KU82_9PEZI|nr:hypothetical protein CPLU01_02881 [Colletotrichum plurivorum]
MHISKALIGSPTGTMGDGLQTYAVDLALAGGSTVCCAPVLRDSDLPSRDYGDAGRDSAGTERRVWVWSRGREGEDEDRDEEKEARLRRRKIPRQE